MTFDVITKKDLSLDIIKSQLKQLTDINTAVEMKNRSKLLDFFEGRGNKDEYLKNYGFKQYDMPLAHLKLTEKIIHKTSLLYKSPPERRFVEDNNFGDYVSDNPRFNESLKQAERYKNLLHNVLYMPLYTQNGWRYYIYAEWIPWFTPVDNLNPIAYSIPLNRDSEEEEWLFVSDTHWFIHDSKGENLRPDLSFEAAKDLNNPLNINPAVEMRKKYPVTEYWPDGEMELVTANQSINMSLNDIFGLIHYEGSPEKFMRGVTPEEIGKTRNTRTGAWEGEIKSGFGVAHAASSPDADMKILDKNPKIAESVDAIQKIIQWVSQTYNVNMKFEMSGTAPSGFSLMVENIDLLEAREDDIARAEISEKEIYNIISKQNELYKLQYKMPALEGKNRMSVNFSDFDFPINQKEEIDRWEWEIKSNAKTILDYMRSKDPELDDDELMAKYEENKATNQQLTPSQQAFREQLNKLNEPQTDTQQ